MDAGPRVVRTNIESEIDTLYDLGARRFMVAILPIKIPSFAAAGSRVNPELKKIPAEERLKHPDVRIANSQWGSSSMRSSRILRNTV